MSNLSDTLLTDKRDAERLFCACAFVSPDLVKHDCGWLDENIFSDDRYKKFWGAIKNGIDNSTAALECGLFTDLVAAQLELSSTMVYPAFAKAISEGAYMASIAESLPKIARMIGDRDRESLNKEIAKIAEMKIQSNIKIDTAIEVAMKFAELIGMDDITIQTNIAPYDNALGGFARKTLNIIAARPSMGKTGLAWQIVRNMAASKKRVIFFSLEMPSTTLWARAVCGALRIPWKLVRSNKITPAQHDQIINKSAELMEAYGEYLFIDDGSRIDSDHIWQAVSEYQPDCIVVDHSSLLADKSQNEILRLGQITWTGKQIAKEFDLPAIYLQQLSRNTEQQGRKDRRPIMSDLRDSGEIEQNADTVTFIYREDYYELQTAPVEWSSTELIIAKNRDDVRNITARTEYNLIDQWFYSKTEREFEETRRKP